MEQLHSHIINPPKPSRDGKQNPSVIAYISKTHQLRLQALLMSPEGFASSYDIEVKRSWDESFDRLLHDRVSHFWLVDRPITSSESPNDYFTQLADARFLGSLVLLGPINSPSQNHTVSARTDPILSLTNPTPNRAHSPSHPASEAIDFHLNAMFISPECRRQGWARRLLNAALAKATAEAHQAGLRMRCSILVNAQNLAARKVYEDVGFVVTGSQMYVQLPRSRLGENGEREVKALHLVLER